MRENFYTTNLLPEAILKYRLSFKYFARGNVTQPLSCKITTGGHA
jgi:hypothetical protein